MMQKPIHIIGAGLAGSEAAWQLAEGGFHVVLHEMRPQQGTAAHQTEHFAELVCSNSFRSDDHELNAVGLLHQEMRELGSLIMSAADNHQVPAGSALAVDRDLFSKEVHDKISAHPLIQVELGEVTAPLDMDADHILIATGPLTSNALSTEIARLSGTDQLSFFDAIAPIIHFDSINMDICWFQSRYDKVGPGGTGKDYLNCPMDKAQYEAFIDALLQGEKTEFKDWENVPYFDGCLPIEVMAERGIETLRHGPLKPMGLTNAHKPETKPYAVVQLRQDNKLGTLWNMVGFQTKLKYGVQAEIFKTIPGLEDAEFARLGGLHRNTYLNSPHLLDESLQLKSHPQIRFAGQITGCEGYVESAAMGLVAARMIMDEVKGLAINLPPETTAHGALLRHITSGHLSHDQGKVRSFQPMNINFGLFPPVEVEKPAGKRMARKEKSQMKKKAITSRALTDLKAWLG